MTSLVDRLAPIIITDAGHPANLTLLPIVVVDVFSILTTTQLLLSLHMLLFFLSFLFPILPLLLESPNPTIHTAGSHHDVVEAAKRSSIAPVFHHQQPINPQSRFLDVNQVIKSRDLVRKKLCSLQQLSNVIRTPNPVV